MSTDELVATLMPFLAEEPEGLVTAYLFGSFARGQASAKSDVDLGVLYREPPERALDSAPMRLEDRLERALGRTVQVCTLNTAPPDLTHRVLRDGILLLDADPALRIRFEVRARNEYADLLPHLRRYRRSRVS